MKHKMEEARQALDGKGIKKQNRNWKEENRKYRITNNMVKGKV